MGKVQSIQNLGATHTYIRRYLYLLAMNVLENDVVDAAEPKAPPVKAPVKVESKPEPKATPEEPQAEAKQFDMKGEPRDWQLHLKGEGTWDDLAMRAAKLALEVAATADDCTSIFKVNHSIFEKMKLEYPTQYDLLIKQFKARKAALSTTQE
jgi:hypothetical protein